MCTITIQDARHAYRLVRNATLQCKADGELTKAEIAADAAARRECRKAVKAAQREAKLQAADARVAADYAKTQIH